MLWQRLKIALSRANLDPDVAVAQVYRPIIRGYFGIAGLYYVIMTLTHFWDLSGSDQTHMISASIPASIAMIGGWFALRHPLGVGKLEAMTSIANLLVLTNVMVALHIEYAPPKLIYFMMLAMIFAFACVSLRQALISITAALGCLFFELLKHDPKQLEIYGFISFAAAVSALAITFFLRRSIGLAVAARREAESGLEEAKSLGETMRRRSLSDSLTGLPNRRAFFETFDKYKNPMHSSHSAWLILLDLDGFKAVNDVHGHIMGDHLLKAVSNRLIDFCDDDAHVCRMGGDEFNFIFPKHANSEYIETWCEELLKQVANTYQIEDRLIQISASIGCTPIVAGETGNQLIRNADYALLHAKKNGKNKVIVFQEEHAKDAAERFEIEQALRVADFDAEIELVYQPQFNLGQNRIVRAEALARWNSPIIGKIGPDRFIKVAEESGLITSITLAVLQQAITALKSWTSPFPLSINLSGHDLISDQTIDRVIQEVEKSNLDPSLIEFEVTETAIMPDVQKASANLIRLSELGHPLALDDFGTGYSNFSYLRTLPIDKLKVDRFFIENLTDPMTEKVLRSLVGMARTLDVECLLEGIENELGLVTAKRVGAQSIQGFLFGKPMNADDFRKSLEAQNSVPAIDILPNAMGE